MWQAKRGHHHHHLWHHFHSQRHSYHHHDIVIYAKVWKAESAWDSSTHWALGKPPCGGQVGYLNIWHSRSLYRALFWYLGMRIKAVHQSHGLIIVSRASRWLHLPSQFFQYLQSLGLFTLHQGILGSFIFVIICHYHQQGPVAVQQGVFLHLPPPLRTSNPLLPQSFDFGRIFSFFLFTFLCFSCASFCQLFPTPSCHRILILDFLIFFVDFSCIFVPTISNTQFWVSCTFLWFSPHILI